MPLPPYAILAQLLTTENDVKPHNIFVNYKDQDEDDKNRFSEVQLGDFGGTYPQDSRWAREGTLVGAPIWTSPEVLMETP